MKVRAQARNGHPSSGALALFSRRDLPFLRSVKIRLHLQHCANCQERVESFQSATAELRREAEGQTLTGFEAIADWSRLEREMLGNIAVGVAAGRCIDRVGRKRSVLGRVSLAVGLSLLFILGWMTHIPSEQTEHIWSSVRQWAGLRSPDRPGTVLRSLPDGLAVRAHGSTLTMMHPISAVVSVSSSSGMEARYIDETTGRVTITTVYGQ